MKQVNKLRSDEDLFSRIQLLVPFRGQKLEQPDEEAKRKQILQLRNQMIRRFQKQKKCTMDEAKAYLENADFDLKVALQEFEGDEEWEKKNPFTGFSTTPPKVSLFS